jgi:hypothetical protein
MPTMPALPALLRRSRARMSTSSVTLPQISTVLSISDHRSAGGHDYGLIRAHSTGHYTVILAATGATLRDWEQLCNYAHIDLGPDAWDVVAITAVADTFPRTDTAHRQWMIPEGHHHLDVADLAVDTYLSVTFIAATSAMRTTPEEMGVEVGRRLHTLIGSLHAVGLATTPLTSTQITALGVRAYRGGDTVDSHSASLADIAPDNPHRVRDVFCHNDLLSATWVLAPHVLDPPHLRDRSVLATYPACDHVANNPHRRHHQRRRPDPPDLSPHSGALRRHADDHRTPPAQPVCRRRARPIADVRAPGPAQRL